MIATVSLAILARVASSVHARLETCSVRPPGMVKPEKSKTADCRLQIITSDCRLRRKRNGGQQVNCQYRQSITRCLLAPGTEVA